MEREKYVRALSTLAKVSDALKTPMADFHNEDIFQIKQWCEEWGHNWQKDFKKNITPKGHDMIFVIHKDTQNFPHVLQGRKGRRIYSCGLK